MQICPPEDRPLDHRTVSEMSILLMPNPGIISHTPLYSIMINNETLFKVPNQDKSISPEEAGAAWPCS